MANLISTTIDGTLTTEGEGTVITQSGTTVAIDLATGNYFEITMDNISGPIGTLTINNLGGAGYVSYFTLHVTQAATARDFAWAALRVQVGGAIMWPNGGSGAPTMTSTDNKIDIYSFTTWDNGTSWYGRIIGQNF